MRRAPSVTLAASCACPAVFMKSLLMCARSVASAAGESAAVAEAEALARSKVAAGARGQAPPDSVRRLGVDCTRSMNKFPTII